MSEVHQFLSKSINDESMPWEHLISSALKLSAQYPPASLEKRAKLIQEIRLQSLPHVLTLFSEVYTFQLFGYVKDKVAEINDRCSLNVYFIDLDKSYVYGISSFVLFLIFLLMLIKKEIRILWVYVSPFCMNFLTVKYGKFCAGFSLSFSAHIYL